MCDVIELEKATAIPRENSYILSYPHILRYFGSRETFTESDVIVGSHIVFGWISTILELRPAPTHSIAEAARVLDDLRRGTKPSEGEVLALARLVNNSVVAASKLLHFVAPDDFAIWDTNVCRYMFDRGRPDRRPSELRLYREYLDRLAAIKQEPEFAAFHASVNRKLGYEVSPLRAIELIMYLNAKA